MTKPWMKDFTWKEMSGSLFDFIVGKLELETKALSSDQLSLKAT